MSFLVNAVEAAAACGEHGEGRAEHGRRGNHRFESGIGQPRRQLLKLEDFVDVAVESSDHGGFLRGFSGWTRADLGRPSFSSFSLRKSLRHCWEMKSSKRSTSWAFSTQPRTLLSMAGGT